MDGEPTKDNILEKEFKINNGHIFIGKTLEKEVLHNDKYIMLLFYSYLSWNCKGLLLKY